jgi:hypothetical protein
VAASRPAAEAPAAPPPPPPVEQPAAVVTPEPAPEPEPEPAPEPEPEESPEPVKDLIADNPKRRKTDKRPDIRPPETMQLYPVPLGKLIYEDLTAGFVDFPKLLRSLAKDQHSGYVRLTGDGFSSVLLFSNGAVVEAIYDSEGVVATSEEAFIFFGNHIDEGEGALDVISLTAEMVTGIYQLLTGPSLFDGLLARFVKADALIDYLSEIGHSGAMIARNDKRSGIVIFRDGEILGAYTDSSRDVELDPVKVLAVCKEPSTGIEVRGGEVPASLPVMEPGQEPRQVSSSSLASGAVAAQFAAGPGATAPVADTAPVAGAPVAEDGIDWPSLINEMAGRADAVLGTRAKKVKELLYATNQSRDDVDSTIDKIAELSIMFVDPSKLTTLADDMRRIAASAA